MPHVGVVRRVTAFAAAVTVMLVVGAGVARAGPGPYRWEDNGHWYEAVALNVPPWITWSEARALASARTHNGIAGHLATITSESEQSFVQEMFPGALSGGYWLGGYQDASAPDYSEPAGGWRWITGEAWEYTNWAHAEPNNMHGPSWNETRLHFAGPSGGWNDLPDNHGWVYGFLVEYSTPPVASEASGLMVLGLCLGASGVALLRPARARRR